MRRVLDVRYRPQSRRPGMSKTRLGALLGEHGIAYETRRGLGTPPDLRFFYRAGRRGRGRRRLPPHLDAAAGDELDALAAELPAGPPPRCCAWRPTRPHCHRRVVAEALARRRGDLEVIDLSQAAGQRRDEALEGRVDVDRDAEAPARLQQHEAVEALRNARAAWMRVVAVELPAAQHGETTSTVSPAAAGARRRRAPAARHGAA